MQFPPEGEPEIAVNRKDPHNPNWKREVYVDVFEQEKEAYAHLLHYGICDKGVVPHCYGWLHLSSHHLQQISALPEPSNDLRWMTRHTWMPIKAILIEYFPDAVRLTHDKLTEELADIALRGLYDIHSAYVVHGDIHHRNILLLPGKRIVWVDFNSSRNPSGELVCRRQEFLEELWRGWGEFYTKMVGGLFLWTYTF